MNARNKKRIVVIALALVSAVSFVFYYHYFRQLSPVINGPASIERMFTAHAAALQAVAFSPAQARGEIIASASTDGEAKIWRRDDGGILQTLKHPGGITSIAFSPDGTYLATSGYDSNVMVWRTADGALTKTLVGHSGAVWTVAYSPDGNSIASSGEDKTIRLWNAATGELLKTLTGHALNVWSVTFSPDGRTLASSGFDTTIKIWDVQTGNLAHTINGHSQAVLEVAFSLDGAKLVSCSDDTTIRIWNTKDWTLLRTLSGSEHVYAVAFSPDGKQIISGGRDRSTFGELLQNFLGETEKNRNVTVRLWNAVDGTLLQSFADHANDVFSVAFSADGKSIVSGGEDKRVFVYRLP
jgi:uncharacterized protein with WD repeat